MIENIDVIPRNKNGTFAEGHTKALTTPPLYEH